MDIPGWPTSRPPEKQHANCRSFCSLSYVFSDDKTGTLSVPGKAPRGFGLGKIQCFSHQNNLF